MTRRPLPKLPLAALCAAATALCPGAMPAHAVQRVVRVFDEALTDVEPARRVAV